MRYFIHPFVIGSFLLGADYVANDGAETAKAFRSLQLRAVWNDIMLQNYEVAAKVSQEVQYYRPGLMAQAD
jgi:hypothetical protein